MRIANGELASREEAGGVKEITDTFQLLRDARGFLYLTGSVALLDRCSLLAARLLPCAALTAPCRDGACSDTKDTENACYTFLVARPAGRVAARELQWPGYTQDTDENREYLQNQIPPMQIGRHLPQLCAGIGRSFSLAPISRVKSFTR